MNKQNKKTKIAIFFGGKISRHLVMLREAGKKEGVGVDLISYNRVFFETDTGKVMIRGMGDMREIREVGEYDVIFFRTTGKHWEEVDLISYQLRVTSYELKKKPVVVDPLVESGKPSYACKAWQMLKLAEAGIPVPKTVYGSLWFLYQIAADHKFGFPLILKGSGGDRGTRVFKADNLGELERLVRDLRKTETEEGKRYMLQEYIENKGDYRVLVLGDKVLGVMKRTALGGDFRNNFSMWGSVEVSDLPEEIKRMAVEAAKICGLLVAGVDIVPKSKIKDQKSKTWNDYAVLEVNKGPQFRGFMQATGIDVPREIIKFLKNLIISK